MQKCLAVRNKSCNFAADYSASGSIKRLAMVANHPSELTFTIKNKCTQL